MSTLRPGSHGPEVSALQTSLNACLTPSPRLVVDGLYGGATRRAVLAFQAQAWLVEDGIAGPATQNALFSTETYAPILHRVPFIFQPTDTTCWAAATAMMTNSTVPAVIARTPNDMILADGSLANYSDTPDGVSGAQRYGRIHGLRSFAPMSWPVATLRSTLSRGPLMLDMLWDAREYAQGRGSPGHFIVVVGLRGDDDASGRGTTLRIFDPWKPGQGARYSVGYFAWIREVPTRTYRVFQR